LGRNGELLDKGVNAIGFTHERRDGE
jgi:hypothetical protein